LPAAKGGNDTDRKRVAVEGADELIQDSENLIDLL
jgi:hypothetical protein